MNRIYLSPHLDDAVLSCGGAIHRQTIAGDSVLVITIFAGDAQGGSLSPFALVQHDYWGNPPHPMALRRAEDIAALALLGVGSHHLPHLDAVYRTGDAGQPLYADEDSLFGDVHQADPLGLEVAVGLVDLLDGIISHGNGAVVYAPLAVGRHVDHQIVHRAAWQLVGRNYRVAFYEDYPYAERLGALELALQAAGPGDWRPEDIPLDASNLTAKISALAYYRSQLKVLFGDSGAMPNRVWAFAATRSPGTGLAERTWWPSGK